jgi:hypothetical protein
LSVSLCVFVRRFTQSHRVNQVTRSLRVNPSSLVISQSLTELINSHTGSLTELSIVLLKVSQSLTELSTVTQGLRVSTVFQSLSELSTVTQRSHLSSHRVNQQSHRVSQSPQSCQRSHRVVNSHTESQSLTQCGSTSHRVLTVRVSQSLTDCSTVTESHRVSQS